MLLTKELKYSYAQGKMMSFPDLSLKEGDQCLLIGNSGSGKTTLLQLLSGMRTPKSGTVKIGETSINKLKPAQLDKFRGKHIGIIFQQSHFVRALKVWENLALAQNLAGAAVNKNRINSLLDRLNIADKYFSKTDELSVGEQQRVAIARALINHPSIIFADEPTSALDDQNTAKVLKLLSEEAKRENATLFIVTHDQRLKDKFKTQIELNVN